MFGGDNSRCIRLSPDRAVDRAGSQFFTAPGVRSGFYRDEDRNDASARHSWLVRQPRGAAGGGALRVVERLVRDVPERLREEWQALADDGAEPNAFAEPWFVSAGLRNLADREVWLLEVRDAGENLVGLIPVAVCDDYGRLKVRHVENWRHHHDFLGTPLIRDGREQSFWRAVIGHLDAAEWAPGFFHATGLTELGPVHRGLEAAAKSLGRASPVVHRTVRAVLASALPPNAYYEATVRKKKRKELQRLRNRLDELGQVAVRRLSATEALEPWCDIFLTLERSGWKGDEGSALGCRPIPKPSSARHWRGLGPRAGSNCCDSISTIGRWRCWSIS